MKTFARVIAATALTMTAVAVFAQAPPKMDNMAKADIMLMKPATVKSGANQFEVMVKDAAGKPLSNADVAVTFVMPKTGNMAEMRNTVKLKGMGGGMYTGQGNVMMAGTWNVTIDVMQRGKSAGQKTITLTAK